MGSATLTRILSLIYVLLLAACATPTGGLTVAAMETYFEEAVFVEPPVIKWSSPATIFVSNKANIGPTDLAYADAAEVFALAGIQASRVDRIQDANLVVFLEPDMQGRLYNNLAVCAAHRTLDGQEIRAATIAADALSRCIWHETMHAIGFGGHLKRGPASTLSVEGGWSPLPLAPADRLAIAVLYDPRIKVGMTPAEARPVVRQILREKLGG